MDYVAAMRGEKQPGERNRRGCAAAAWVAVAVLAAMLGYIGFRTWAYVRAIRTGGLQELPQFEDRFTATPGTLPGAEVLPRAAVETAGNPTLGAGEDAPLTLVAFADFECPYSREEMPIVRKLMARHGDKVRFIYRDYPLEDIHPRAAQAAEAAECAGEQGKFWAYHDKLYANASALELSDLARYADEAGVDRAQFDRCLADRRYRQTVAEDAAAAKNLGVAGTPTFFFNGYRVEGAIPEETFERLIAQFVTEK